MLLQSQRVAFALRSAEMDTRLLFLLIQQDELTHQRVFFSSPYQRLQFQVELDIFTYSS